MIGNDPNILCLKFLGALGKSRKTPFSFVLSVRPSVRMYAPGSTWTDSRQIWHWKPSWKSVEKFHVTSPVDNITGHYMGQEVRLYCWQQYRMFCRSTTITKGTYCCFNMATLSMFVLAATCLVMQMELSAFSWQQWLDGYAKT